MGSVGLTTNITIILLQIVTEAKYGIHDSSKSAARAGDTEPQIRVNRHDLSWLEARFPISGTTKAYTKKNKTGTRTNMDT